MQNKILNNQREKSRFLFLCYNFLFLNYNKTIYELSILIYI